MGHLTGVRFCWQLLQRQLFLYILLLCPMMVRRIIHFFSGALPILRGPRLFTRYSLLRRNLALQSTVLGCKDNPPRTYVCRIFTEREHLYREYVCVSVCTM